MALNSPGVQVSIVDESQYLSAAPASVPLIILATAQNKAASSGTAVASATIAANANKLYRVTSQRDLTTLFGNPFFYKTTAGTPIQGYELNEYGLLAAYSVLGSTNLAYVLRADIDLAELIGRTTRPSAEVEDSTYWLDAANSNWGIFQFNQSTGAFTSKIPYFVKESYDMVDSTGCPVASIGNIGDYAISMRTNVTNFTVATLPHNSSTYWFKDKTNTWVQLGSREWRKNWPAVQGANSVVSPADLTADNAFTINDVVITIASGEWSVDEVADAINAANIPGVSADAVSNKIEIYSEIAQEITIASVGASTILNSLGIAPGVYNAARVFFGTNAEQPRWRSTDSNPHPTGSVWVKTNAANGGTNLVFSQYSTSLGSYVSRLCSLGTEDWVKNVELDSTGGGAIAEGSLYARWSVDPTNLVNQLQVYRRASSGPSVFVGTATEPVFSAGQSFTVRVSRPNQSTLSDAYTVTISGSGSLSSSAFVTAWRAANIPFTEADVAPTGAIVLTHTVGGVIVLDDAGAQNSPLTAAGFSFSGSNSTLGAKWGPYKTVSYTNVTALAPPVLNGAAKFTVVVNGYVPEFTITNGGAGYNLGATLTLQGAGSLADYTLRVTAVDEESGAITEVILVDGQAVPQYTVQLSAWEVFSFIPNEIPPSQYPLNGTKWYFSTVNQVDIMTNVNGQWKGYRNTAYASNGLPRADGEASTDVAGPIVSASEPLAQSNGDALVYGDLWIDTSDLDNYPIINRWQNVDDVDQWVRIDVTDQTSENGIVFADARWGTSGSVDPVEGAFPAISALLTSNYLDLDAPEASLYPQGTLLFNTRRSGYNVKEYRTKYFTNTNFPGKSLPAEKSAWVTVSGLKANGAAHMGRKAQRNMVVQALRSAINTNAQILEEDTFFNLIAAPGYPELQPDMVTLNNNRGQTAYIIGDTPLRLRDNANDIVSWATNEVGATSTGEDGLVTRNTYMGLYYPSGITTDLTGAEVAVPSSHMILRTMIYNDNVAYPWFAPAGQRRGIIDNANNIGYIDSISGEFQTTKNRVALRDVEYTNFINPISYFTNLGLLNYGNKNSFDSLSSLDRTNVARLVCYIRHQLQRALRPFIFEPNDTITRSEARGVVQTLLADILSKRGIYDYLVVCDESNNTPARIDRNELWIDIAIEPVKAVEFIFVPVRLLNTGELSG